MVAELMKYIAPSGRVRVACSKRCGRQHISDVVAAVLQRQGQGRIAALYRIIPSTEQGRRKRTAFFCIEKVANLLFLVI